jgi:hypothetical protein
MRRRLGLLLLLAGTFVAARTAVALATSSRPPAAAPFALHAVTVPLAQLALLEAAGLLRARRTGGA